MVSFLHFAQSSASKIDVHFLFVHIVDNMDLLEKDLKFLIQKIESSGDIGSTSHPPTADTSNIPESKNKQTSTGKNKKNATKN